MGMLPATLSTLVLDFLTHWFSRILKADE